jgi:glycosyltransferase involved in cell wall biosynthesis
MKYLVTSDRVMSDSPGGAYRIAWDLAALARDRGHEVTLLAGSTDRDPPPGRSELDGIEVLRYRFPRLSRLNPRRWAAHVQAACQCYEGEAASRPWDVIHAHAPVGALAVFPCAPKSARLVYTVHSPAVLEQRINWSDGTLAGRIKLAFGMPILARQERGILQRADMVHVLSRYTRSELIRLFGAVGEKAIQIPWWARRPTQHRDRAEARRLLGWPEEGPILFTLRRMVPRMGLDLFLEALFPLAHSHRFHAVLAGDGPLRPALTHRASAGGLEGRVIFPGRLSDEQVALAYQAADLFVLPTLALECFGIIILEAFANGLPVIASNVGAIGEAVEPMLPGWLVAPGDVDDLRRRIGDFLEGRLSSPGPEALTRYADQAYSRQKLENEYLAALFGGVGGR